MADVKLKLYGALWCTKSAALRNYLQSKWIDFEDYDVEADQDAEQRVRDLYDGELKFPTMTFGDDFLKNPNFKEVDDFVKKNGLD